MCTNFATYDDRSALAVNAAGSTRTSRVGAQDGAANPGGCTRVVTLGAARRAIIAPLASLGLAIAVAAMASDARAALPGKNTTPVYVLTLRTDDADDQADALTLALRAHVRSAPGWSLAETRQSFETLSIALRCPAQPDTACLQRIADHLRADHFVWGSVARLRAGRVATELHLWNRGRAATEVDETYSDTLTDPTTKAMREEAGSLFTKLTDPTFAVDASEGAVAERAAPHPGPAAATEPRPSEVPSARPPAPEASPYDIRPWENGPVEMAPEPGERTPKRPRDRDAAGGVPEVRVATVLGYSAIVAGTGLLLASGVEIAGWANDKSASSTDLRQVPRSISNVCQTPTSPAAQDACERSKDATTTSTLGWVFGATGVAFVATGLVLVVTDGNRHRHREPGASSAARFEVLPAVDARTRGVSLRIAF